MAETKTVKETREKIFIPKGQAGDNPNFFVSVNGKNYILPKGQESEVPKHVADEIRRSWAAEASRNRKSDELIERTKEPVYTI